MLDRSRNIKGLRILTALEVFAVALSGCAAGDRLPALAVSPIGDLAQGNP